MKRTWIILVVLAAVGLMMTGCGALRAISAADGPAPAQVVSSFYDWYLGYINGEANGEMRNPLADGAYRTSPYLASELIAEVDDLVAGFDKGGFDPFLLAQDIPTSVTVGAATLDGSVATVPVETSFEGHVLRVTLEETDGRWLITAIERAAD